MLRVQGTGLKTVLHRALIVAHKPHSVTSCASGISMRRTLVSTAVQGILCYTELMRIFLSFYRQITVAFLLLPTGALAASARSLGVSIGTSYTFWPIMQRIITYLTGSIGVIALAMFVVGAFRITVSGVKEDERQKGKDLMVGAVLSLAVVLGAYAILRTVAFFLS